jgi:hypothetical protein
MKKSITNITVFIKFHLIILLAPVFLSSCVTSFYQKKQTPSDYVTQGDASVRDGQIDKAISEYSKAIQINPEHYYAYTHRGDAYIKKEQYDKAISDYTKAIELDPQNAWAYNNLAWLFATCPDGKYRHGIKAVELAGKAVSIDKKNTYHLDTLAAAYAEAGDFENAIKKQEEAITILEEETPNTYIERLNSFKANKPWRDKLNPNYQQTKIQFISQCNIPEPSVYQQTIRDIKTIDQFDMIPLVENLNNFPALIQAKLPKGVKEIRAVIYSGYLYPQYLFRLIIDGSIVQGNLYAFWPSALNDDEDGREIEIDSLIETMVERNCKDGKFNRAYISTCRYCFDDQYDWSDVIKKLEELKIWTLPNESELPKLDYFVLDGDGISVDLRSEDHYRSYSYDCPPIRDIPEAKMACLIRDYILGLPNTRVQR